MKHIFWIFLWAMSGGTLAIAALGEPTVTLRINGHGDGSAPQELSAGEPVIAEVILRSTDRPAPGVSLDPPQGAWTNRVKIFAVDAGGASTAWPFIVAGKTSAGALVLQPDAVTVLVLRLDVRASTLPKFGNYDLVARLDLMDGRGWQGRVESEAVAVHIAAAPVAPTGAALGERQLFRVRDALLAGDLPRAEAAADELLRADYNRPEAFGAMALVYEAKGERRRALTEIELAIAHSAIPVEGVPVNSVLPAKLKPVPLEYYDLRRRLAAMPSPEPDPEPLPGWPNNVAAPPSVVPAAAAGSPSVKPVAPAVVVNPDDLKFPLDRRGRWAAKAEASSELSTPKFSARQASGPPNVSNYGHHGEAWSAQVATRKEEWLKVIFATPTRASAVRVRQTFNPGAIVKVEAFAVDGRSEVVWSGHDTIAQSANRVEWFVASFAPPPFPVSAIQFTFDTTAWPGADEIDAVQLIAEP